MSYVASQQTNGQKNIPTLWRERILKRDFEIVLGKMLQSDQVREDETEETYTRFVTIHRVLPLEPIRP